MALLCPALSGLLRDSCHSPDTKAHAVMLLPSDILPASHCALTLYVPAQPTPRSWPHAQGVPSLQLRDLILLLPNSTLAQKLLATA